MVFFKPFNRFIFGVQFNFFFIFFISAYNTSFSPSLNLRLLNSGFPLPTILFTKLITFLILIGIPEATLKTSPVVLFFVKINNIADTVSSM